MYINFHRFFPLLECESKLYAEESDYNAEQNYVNKMIAEGIQIKYIVQ